MYKNIPNHDEIVDIMASDPCSALVSIDEVTRWGKSSGNMERMARLKAAQEFEWKLFMDSKAQFLEKMRVAAAKNSIRHTARLHRNYSGICAAHREELDAHILKAARDAQRFSQVRKSGTVSPDHLGARLPLSDIHNTGNMQSSNASRSDGGKVGDASYHEFIEKKTASIKRRLDAKESAAYRKVLVAEYLNTRCEEDRLQAVAANLKFKESQMAAAHYRQRIAPYFPLVGNHAFGKTQEHMASRGTQLATALSKGRYHMPSLSCLYGDGLEAE
uniref:Uncharacterized protein n=1 Tax=Trypanosoma congolense (strain IL3000) TaxID=1068625 RepID=G0UW32_TRYCI|nr:conserved hypothetical protein [Trypanosoma congolense IL3000]